jgi:hypothetical protein
MWTAKNRGRYDRSKLRYPSDLTDDEWAHVDSNVQSGPQTRAQANSGRQSVGGGGGAPRVAGGGGGGAPRMGGGAPRMGEMVVIRSRI